MELIGVFCIGVACGIGVSILFGTFGPKDEDAIVAPHPAELTLKGTRCVGGHVRHLYEGAAFCLRACGTPNPKWKPAEPVLTTTEGQPLDDFDNPPLTSTAWDGERWVTESPRLVRP